MKHNGFAVIHAHPELRRDPEIALAAVSDRGFVLRYLEDALKAGEKMGDDSFNGDDMGMDQYLLIPFLGE